MQRVFQGLFATLLMAVAAGPVAARPVVPAEKHFWSYDGNLPACDNADVLSRMSSRFEDSQSEYWNSSLKVVGYDQVKTVALRPWGLDHIPRNFCKARAKMSDHSVHEVSYAVIEDEGIIGMDFGVEFCFAGLDRDYTYAPSCKMEQP